MAVVRSRRAMNKFKEVVGVEKNRRGEGVREGVRGKEVKEVFKREERGILQPAVGGKKGRDKDMDRARRGATFKVIKNILNS